MIIDALVEGAVDEAVARKVIHSAGHDFGICYGKRGIGYIKSKVRLFNAAASRGAILVLVDFMDTGAACPPEVLSSWLPNRKRNMLFRVVVREIESWLLADRNNLSNFIGITPSHLSQAPETLDDPKRALISYARKSNRRQVRQTIVPSKGSSAQVGALYTTEMIRFVRQHWNIQEARRFSPSLESCMQRLEQLHSQQNLRY